jgi:hypothetical protein
MIRRLGVPETIQFCLGTGQRSQWGPNVDKDKLLSFLKAIDPFLDKEIQVRVEGSNFSIYCKDEMLFNNMCKKLDHWIMMTFAPANTTEHEFMINSANKKVLCNHIPYHTYPLKVYLKTSIKENVREQFYKWIQNYNGKILATGHTKEWLIGRKKWSQNPCIYVVDRPTLSMVGLFLGDRVSKVEEFIPRSSINSSTDQEQTCQHLVKV